MHTRTRTIACFSFVPILLTAGAAVAQQKPAPRRPEVGGAWTGTWELYTPPAPGATPKKALLPPQPLQAQVTELPEGKWQATFEGEAGGVYKYTIKMLGRQTGSVILFQGTADLGQTGGGVYDWIGRATDNEFVGFYTSEGHTGTFRLARPKPADAK